MNAMIKKNFLFLLFGAMFLLSACALPGIPVNPSNPMYSVAVLPFYNATNDVDGPQMVREMTEKKLARWHYKSAPLNEVDQLLRDKMGVTLGAQLEMTTAQKLGETLGVDGVLYGYLLNFDQITTGLYNVKKVRGGVRLVDTKTGKTVWAKGQGVKSELKSGGLLGSAVGALKDVQDVREGIEPFKSIQGIGEIRNLDNWYKMASQQESDILKAGAMSLLEKTVAKALKVHLKTESGTMLDMIFSDFPAGPGGPGGAPVMAASMPAVEMKMPEPVMPSFGYYGYMDVGKRDFSADFVTTVYDKGEKREFSVNGSFARRGEDMRSEFDATNAMKAMAGDAPKVFSRFGVISIGKEDVNHMLYHDAKKYITNKEKEGVKGKEPKIEKEKLGEETVAGHPSVKYKVTVTEDNEAHTGYIWEAKDLDGFVVRTEFEDKDAKSVTEFKNIVLKSPSPTLFQLPKDYTKAANFMELMMEAK